MRSAEWREDGGAQTDVSLQSVSDCLSTPEKIAHASHEYGGVQPSGAVASGAPNHAALPAGRRADFLANDEILRAVTDGILHSADQQDEPSGQTIRQQGRPPIRTAYPHLLPPQDY